MCLFSLCVLLQLFFSVTFAVISEKSCQELGLNPLNQGGSLVCATSRAETLGLKDCGVRKTWTLAQSACVEIGMRLCTSEELAADEALNTGCALELERVWTRTGCMDDGETQAVVQAGSSAGLSIYPPNCTRLGAQMGVRCCADVFVCESDECSQTADEGNVCLPTATGYQCVCSSQFSPGPGRTSCVRLPAAARPTTKKPTVRPTPLPTPGSPCAARPCSESLDVRNRCFPNAADRGSYRCSCQGYRFKNSADARSCVYIPDACANSTTCKSNLSRRNVCFDNLDGTYTCTCDSPRFQATEDGSDCFEQTDPCFISDPCATTQDSENTCVSQPNGDFQCRCFGRRWYAATNTSCRLRTDPCLDDPCFILQDAGNRCIVNEVSDENEEASSYQCDCRGARSRNTSDFLSCEIIPQPCETHNCRTEQVGNLCVARSNGTQYCVCLALGFQASSDLQSCEVRTSACRSDPCLSTKNDRNVCVDYRNGTYRCTCATNYYIVSLNGGSCLPAPNYCVLSDPCLTRYQGNKCVYSCQGERCNHVCQCLEGWMNVRDAAGRDTCERTPQPCLPDPCLRREDIQNSCVDLGAGRWRCNCGGARYAPRLAADGVTITGCQKTDDICLTPQAAAACATNVTGNLCIDTTSDNRLRTFQCACSALGWTKRNATACIPPPNRCLEGGIPGYCSVRDNATGVALPGNRCVDNRDGTYACICLQPGWNPNFGAQRCIAPVDFCARALSSGQDVCYTRVSGVNNQCVDLRNGTYFCRCDTTRGYRASIGAQRCEAPVNGCLDNPCLQGRDALNTCTSRPDGTWVCVCGGFDYIPDPDRPPGTACKFQLRYNECYNYTSNPLNLQNYDPKDPCRLTGNPDNSCIDLRRPVNGHQCICRNGFINRTIQSANGIPLWCEPPVNACAAQDPCRIAGGNRFNFCVYDGNGQYHCECAQRGWNVSQDGKSCRQVGNPCLGAPCTAVAGNVCTNLGDGTYTCNCTAAAYLNTQGNQRCIQRANLCLYNDPCSTRANRRNQCLSFPEYYNCNCLGRGWTTAVDQKSCIPPPNACLLNVDACQSRFNSLNYCIDHKDGTYNCDCSDPYFDVSPNAQNCSCRSPCLIGDPCNVIANSNNSCVILAPGDSLAGNLKSPTNCGIFRCTCNQGWFKVTTLWGTERCQPPDPCNRFDPCSSSSNPGNLCINGYDGLGAQYNPLTDPLNPVNVAIRSTAGQPVRPLPSYNSLSNYNSNTDYPLQVLSNPALQNLFLTQPPVLPLAALPTTFSTAFFPGRRMLGVDPLKKTAFPRPRILSFPKREVRTHANVAASYLDDRPTRRARLDFGDASTIFYAANSYFCQCEATGWTTPLGAQFCLPPNRCTQGDPCATARDYLNTCTPGSRTGSVGIGDVLNDPYIVNLTPNGYGADYSCNCAARGWYPSSDRRFCLPCANPCKSAADPCNVARGTTNICFWEFDETPSLRRQAQSGWRRQGGLGENQGTSSLCGRYLCVCDNANMWVSSSKGQTCVKCGDACAGDPCKSTQNEGNSCQNTVYPSLLNYNSTLQGELGENPPALLDFPNILNQVQASRQPANPCGVYNCTCAEPEWIPTQNGNSCVRCINPCESRADPCKVIASGSRNTCEQTELVSDGEGGVGRRLLQLNANSYSNLAVYGEFCGPYVCTCGTGYVAIAGRSQCTACVDPCIAVRARDPCRVASGNVCTVAPPDGGTTPGPGRRLLEEEDDEVQRRQTNTLPLPSCGPFLCVCNLPDFVAVGTQRCAANCINQCTSGVDPCLTQNSTRNSCLYFNAAFGQDCGYHRCTCGVGFTTAFGNQACIMNAVATRIAAPNLATKLASPITKTPTSAALVPSSTSSLAAPSASSSANVCPKSDPCVIKQQGNKCKMSGSSVVCTCGNSMFTPGPDGSTCEQKCRNPAQLAGIMACKVTSITKNVCYIAGKSWNCICAVGTLKSDTKDPTCT